MPGARPARDTDWSPAQDERLRAVWCGGGDLDQLAVAIGRGRRAIANRAWKLRLQRPARRPSDAEDQRLAALVREGTLVPDAARELGITACAAYQRLRRLRRQGVDLPDLRADQARIDEALRRSRDSLRRLRDRRILVQPAASPADLLWLAGVLDARGSIAVSRGKPVVSITTGRRALAAQCWLATGIGEIYREIRSRTGVIWRWSTCSGDDVVTLLRQVAPLMRVRRPLATAVSRWPVCPHTRDLTPEELALRAEITETVRHHLATEDLPPPDPPRG